MGFLPASTHVDVGPSEEPQRFQSRRGFSPCFDAGASISKKHPTTVSIPSWVFSLLRPRRAPGLSGVLTEFQSRRGFSPCFDGPIGDSGTVAKYAVSIPSWVFSLLRRTTGSRPTCWRCVSIPSWVFSLLRLYRAFPIECPAVFQSRRGFSPCFDGIGVITTPVHTSVSIPSWVFSLLRQLYTGVERLAQCVSIPSWVFSLLRPGAGCRGILVNLVSIPSWVFSLLRPGDLTVSFPFQEEPFQSRRGFSPCFDARPPTTRLSSSTSFNPVVGFLPASTWHGQASAVKPMCFNPVVGFLPASTLITRRPAIRTSSFNPVVGFLPASTSPRGFNGW